jgi:hypothetical protein
MLCWYDIKTFLKSPFIKRTYRHIWQHFTRGWSDEDTWSLDKTMARFVLPRLIRFREINNGYPNDLTEERWDAILDEMIWALDYIVNDGENYYFDKDKLSAPYTTEQLEEWKKLEDRCDNGMKLFGEYFRALWW